jgi:hypothetical protein
MGLHLSFLQSNNGKKKLKINGFLKNRNINRQFIIIFFLCLVINGFSQSIKNFLILENPFEHRIYNKYEQNISFNDSSYFIKYCPIEILEEDTLLSDNYTPCFIGRIENHTYYFLIPERFKPFSKLYNSYSYYIKDVYSIQDTIQIIQDKKILFYNAKNKSLKEYLPKETKLIRTFKKGIRTYVKNLNYPVKFGWSDLRNKKAWEVYKSKVSETNQNLAEIESIIKTKINEVNELLKKLFNHFNHLNQTNIKIPYWTFVNKENKLLCTLLNNENNFDFTESTNILVNELQLSLVHTSFKAFWQSNDIIIHKK